MCPCSWFPPHLSSYSLTYCGLFFFHQSLNAPVIDPFLTLHDLLWQYHPLPLFQLPLLKGRLPNIQFLARVLLRRRPKYLAACRTSSLTCSIAPQMHMTKIEHSIFFPKSVLFPLHKWPHSYLTSPSEKPRSYLNSSFLTPNTQWLKSYTVSQVCKYCLSSPSCHCSGWNVLALSLQ